MAVLQMDITVIDCESEEHFFSEQNIAVSSNCLEECNVELELELCVLDTLISSDAFPYDGLTQQEFDDLIAQNSNEYCIVVDTKEKQYDYTITTTTNTVTTQGDYGVGEFHLYGSSRLGLINEDQRIVYVDYEQECVEVETETVTKRFFNLIQIQL